MRKIIIFIFGVIFSLLLFFVVKVEPEARTLARECLKVAVSKTRGLFKENDFEMHLDDAPVNGGWHYTFRLKTDPDIYLYVWVTHFSGADSNASEKFRKLMQDR